MPFVTSCLLDAIGVGYSSVLGGYSNDLVKSLFRRYESKYFLLDVRKKLLAGNMAVLMVRCVFKTVSKDSNFDYVIC